jgi:hypothetical protein
MLWMSSATWFDFLARRFRELQRTQISLRRIKPPNMGVLTGIVCNMIRSITSTPIILDFHVRESMAILRFSQVCERSGMFFLSDLDLESIPCLSDIQLLDDAEVMRLVGAKSADRHTHSRRIWPVLSSIEEQETFPIGERPTWQVVIKTITDTPWKLMRAWRWDSRLIHIEPVIGKLFTDFTCQMWLFLHKHWLADPANVPAPSSLEEAMACWSVDRVYRSITACAFEACNANLPGALLRGRPQTPFSARFSIFFPPPDGPCHARSPWKPFHVKPGYLWQFHQLMDVREEQERIDINDRLGEIFSNLQCLPTSVATSKKVVGKPWVVNKQGMVQFITNPMFYKILGLADTSIPIQRRTGPRAIKPIHEFTLDMYRFAGYDELVARQSLYLERHRLRMASRRKSTKAKRSRKPPLARKRAASPQQDENNSLVDSPSEDRDALMEELFGPEDMDVSMEDVDSREGGRIITEDVMEDLHGPYDSDMSMEDITGGDHGDVDMTDFSSGEEEGQLVEEEDDGDYDCQTEDEGGIED